MTTAPPTYGEAVDRLVDASSQLAAFAEQEQGAARAATAAELAAQITHAITTDPETERTRERVRVECAAHLEWAAAYIGSVPEIAEKLSSFVDRAAALAEEVVEFAAVAVDMDRRGVALFGQAQAVGEPGSAPQIFESVMQGLRQHDSDGGMAWRRLFLAGRRDRSDAAHVLSELVSQMRRT
jgi:hypothetical protein